jgi:Ca2+-binding EF-hand superfamily protein
MTAISKVEVIFNVQRLEKAFDYIDYDHTGQI